MVTAFDVAAYFLEQAEKDGDTDISNLKLQKLVFYAQAFHLALFGKPFFEEDFEAWTHGPVCPALYHQYKKFGSGVIHAADSANKVIFSSEQLPLLEEINQLFGQFSAWKLRNMTHEEAPWKDMEATGAVIDKNAMMTFYKSRLK